VLSALALTLGAAALLAGVTGAWSPCGFSMVDTLACGMGDGRRRTRLVSCATFTVGAVLGGVATYGGLAALGGLLHLAGHGAALAVAAVLAGAAAAGEARGVRIVPQIRRQVPEPWRRTMPLALASWLYGILLGMGFTTFVLTLAVWALAGVSLAAGELTLGVVIGVGFGLGRALPVVALVSWAGTAAGQRMVERMEQGPHLLRRLRVADATALALCALLLAGATASAATTVAEPATDPTAAGDDLAWQVPGAGWTLRRGGAAVQGLTGADPALGGGVAAVRQGTTVTLVRRDTAALIGQLSLLDGVDKLAVSDRWFVYRRRAGGGEELFARPLDALSSQRRVARVSGASRLSRPALDGDTLVFASTSRGGSSIVALDLRRGRRTTVRSSRSSQFLHPSAFGGRLLYVEVSSCRQALRLRALSGRGDRILLSLPSTARRDAGHEPGHTGQGVQRRRCPSGSGGGDAALWTTALAGSVAYVTRLAFNADGSATPALVSVGL
jgi:hypothetical protein